jgi:hypothetical protein
MASPAAPEEVLVLSRHGLGRVVALVALAFELGTSASRAQSYGLNGQVLTIGAESFRGIQNATSYLDVDGYMYNPNSDDFGYFVAPLPLPDGARVTQLCMYANDSDTGSFRYAEVYLIAVKLVPGGESPSVYKVDSSAVISTSDIGYGYYCTDPFEYDIHSSIDIDGDGTPDNVVWYMEAYLPGPSQNSLGLGGVRVTWHRQVKPGPETPTFGDVPESDPAYDYIEALAASGITAGCAGGNYCPDAPLTRRQMAVFLAKALGLHWSD